MNDEIIAATQPIWNSAPTNILCAQTHISHSEDAVGEVLEAVVELSGEGVDGLLHHGVHVTVLKRELYSI